MAKYTYDPTDFSHRQEAIRKAKGNPNKNVHRKKNNSNYGGGSRPAKRSAAQEAEKNGKRPPLPRGVKIALWVLIGALLVALVLYYAAFRESVVLARLTSLLIGLLCCYMAYINYFVRKLRGIHTVLAGILAVLGGMYVLSAAGALLSLLNS